MSSMAKTKTDGITAPVTVMLPVGYDTLLNDYVAERRLSDPMAKRAASARELLVDALRRWSESRAARKK